MACTACDARVVRDNPFDPSAPPGVEAEASAVLRCLSGDTASRIAGVKITLTGSRAPVDNVRVSDADGLVAFASVAAGAYVIDVVHPVHMPRSMSLELSPGEEKQVDVVLQPIPSGLVAGNGRIVGTVLKAAEQSLPPEAQDNSGIIVEVTGSGARTFTNLAGEFVLAIVPGTYDLALSAANHVPQAVAGVAVGADETVSLDPVVLAGNPGVLVGVAYREGESLPAQLPTGAEPQHGDILVTVVGVGTATTEPDGSYRVSGVPPGRYSVRASVEGFETTSVDGVDVRGGIDNQVPGLLLPISRGRIMGQVLLAGRPAGEHGGTVVGVESTPYVTLASGDGGFSIDGVPVGTYTIALTHQGYGRQEIASVLVAANATTSVGLVSLVRQQGDFLLAEGQPYTAVVRVGVDLSAPLGNDEVRLWGADVVRFWVESGPGSGSFVEHAAGSWTGFDSALVIEVELDGAADGAKAVSATFRDGTSGVESETFGALITLDREPPTYIPGVAPLLIDGGAAFTNSASAIVTLGFAAADATSGVGWLRVSNDGVFDDEPWESYVLARTHTLASPSTPGVKTVMVEIRDRAGNATTVDAETTASIVLDRGAPTVDSFVVSCSSTLSEPGFCNTPIVRIEIGADDDFDTAPAGVSWMAVANEEGFLVTDFTPFVPARSWLLSPGEGDKTVSLILKDAAGNPTTQLDRTIHVDATPPAGVTVVVTGDAADGPSTRITRSADVTLTLTATDTSLRGIMVSNDNVFSGTTFVASGTQPWTLPSGSGPHTVFIRAVDAAGNQADASTTIELDEDHPVLGAIEIVGKNADGSENRSATATLAVAVELLGQGASEVAMSATALADCDSATYDLTFAPLVPLSLDAGGEVWVCVRDAAGNTDGPLSDSIVVDQSPPSCTVELQGFRADGVTAAPAGSTAWPIVQVTSTCTGSPTGMAMVPSGQALDCETAAYGTFQAVTTLAVDPGAAALKNVLACYRDAVGNVTTAVVSAAAPLTFDGTPPQSPTLTVVRNGAPFTEPASTTAAIDVDLFAQAVGADFMRFGNAPDLTGVPFTTPYSTARQDWQLVTIDPACGPATGEARTVYAQFADALGNESEVVSYSLVLDLCAPSAPSVAFVESPGADVGWVRSFDVAVNVGNTGSASFLRATTLDSFGACPTPTSSTPIVALAPSFITTFSADGPKRVCVLAEDEAGNQSAWGFDDVSVDTTPPVAPSLTPGVLGPVNTACARLLPTLGVPDTLRNWETRTGGGPWQTATMVGPKAELSLVNDTDNLLEVRAIDRAGNVGGSNAVMVSEVSSVFVSTALAVKRICGNGAFALLWDPDGEPYSIGGQSGADPRDRDLAILDLSTFEIAAVNGPGELAAEAAFWSDTTGDVFAAHDAMCNNQGNRLLLTYYGHGPVGSTDETIDRHRMAIIQNVLNPASGLVHLVGGGPVRQTPTPVIRPALIDAVWFHPDTAGTGHYASMVMTTSQTQTTIVPSTECRGIYRLIHAQVSTGGFIELGEIETITKSKAPVMGSCQPTDFNFPSVFGLRGVGLPNYASGVFWFHGYTHGTSFMIWNQQGGGRQTVHSFGASYSAKDLWGKAVRESVWHPNTAGSDFSDNTHYLYTSNTGSVYGGQLWGSAVALGSGGGAMVNGQRVPAFETADQNPGAMDPGWPSHTDARTFVYGTSYTTPSRTTRYRFSIDKTQPIYHSMRTGAGQAEVIYVTQDTAGRGVVIGLRDEATCAE